MTPNVRRQLYSAPAPPRISTDEPTFDIQGSQRPTEVDGVSIEQSDRNIQGALYTSHLRTAGGNINDWKPARSGLVEFPKLVEDDEEENNEAGMDVRGKNKNQMPQGEDCAALKVLKATGDWLMNKLGTSRKRQLSDADLNFAEPQLKRTKHRIELSDLKTEYNSDSIGHERATFAEQYWREKTTHDTRAYR